jgi:hypothetical protein
MIGSDSAWLVGLSIGEGALAVMLGMLVGAVYVLVTLAGRRRRDPSE